MSYLILVRHGKSEWNKLGLWTGQTDVDLIEEGIEEARRAGEAIKDLEIHSVHMSELKRTHQTFEEIRKFLNSSDFKVHIHRALSERDYGVHTGKNKWQVKEEIGEEAFQNIRRGWNTPVEKGETLKDVHDRAVPYYQQNILVELKQGKNVLIVGHGNTFRALVKHLENISDEKVCDVEIGTGEVHCYKFNPEGDVIDKEIRAVNSQKMKV